MHKYSKYFEAILKSPDKEKDLKSLFYETMNYLHENCPEDFYCLLYKLHCTLYGPHFNEELALEAVSCMRNVDGTVGEHWSLKQIESIASQSKVKEVYDFYYVMNMMHSDYSKVLGSDLNYYIEMSKAYMSDPDALEGVAFISWISKMKNKSLHK